MCERQMSVAMATKQTSHWCSLNIIFTNRKWSPAYVCVGVLSTRSGGTSACSHLFTHQYIDGGFLCCPGYFHQHELKTWLWIIGGFPLNNLISNCSRFNILFLHMFSTAIFVFHFENSKLYYISIFYISISHDSENVSFLSSSFC